MGKYTITLYYVTSGTKSATHSLTIYHRHRNNLLFGQNPNINDSIVDTKSVWGTCKMPTPFLIIDESVKNQTKSFADGLTIASISTIKQLFLFCLLLYSCWWLAL